MFVKLPVKCGGIGRNLAIREDPSSGVVSRASPDLVGLIAANSFPLSDFSGRKANPEL